MSDLETIRKTGLSIDRFIDVLRHFYCQEPEELERILDLPGNYFADKLLTGNLESTEYFLKMVEMSGISKDYLTGKTDFMFDTSKRAYPSDSLAVRIVTHLLQILCEQVRLGGFDEDSSKRSSMVADKKSGEPAVDQELVVLLVEALRDSTSRERLINFIRSESSNLSSHR